MLNIGIFAIKNRLIKKVLARKICISYSCCIIYNSDDSYNRLVWCDLLSFDVPQARYF